MFSHHSRFVPGFIVFACMLALLCTAFMPVQPTRAASSSVTGPGWVVVATQETIVDAVLGRQRFNSIYTVNTYTHEVHGPFLMEELTPHNPGTNAPLGGNLFDVAITPDGKTALLSSFSNSLVFFVDVSDPLNPVYLGSAATDIFAEDLAITADGQYAMVSDGGFTNSVYSIDIRAQKVAYELILPLYDHHVDGSPIRGYAHGVAIAPDGTVVVVDYYSGKIHILTIGDKGTLTYLDTQGYYLSKTGEVSLTPATGYALTFPVNVAISPDGQTVLVSDAQDYESLGSPSQYTSHYSLGVYRITAPGELEFVRVITGLTHAMQTVSFAEDGSMAYMLGNDAMSHDSASNPADTYENDRLFALEILGPGEVAFDPAQSTDLLRFTSGQLFGVDGLAVYAGKAYASYPIISVDDDEPPQRYLSVVDLETMQLTQVLWGDVGVKDPVGLAVRPFIPYQMYLPSILQ